MRSISSLFATIGLALFALGCESITGHSVRVPEAVQDSPLPQTDDPAEPPQASEASALRGRLDPMPESLDTESPILIYLEPINALPYQAGEAPTKTVVLRRRAGGLQPQFVLAYRGQVLVFSNQDEVHHAIFSYSEPNAFELGTLAVGETQPIAFSFQGAVRFYCSLHEAEHGLIFVAPSQYLALVDERGEYSLVDVPAGRYRLRTWSAAHSNFDREITLRSGESAWRDITLEIEAVAGSE